MQEQTMADGKTSQVRIQSIGGCGCEEDVRAFLTNGTDICIDAYIGCEIEGICHRNCGGKLKNTGNEVICEKCGETLLSMKAFNRGGN